MHRSLWHLPILLVTMAAASTLAGMPDDTIARARAFIGPEELLSAVTSIHYTGMVEEGTDGEKTPAYKIDMIFQKHYQQRLVITRNDTTETTALNDFEGWHRVQDAAKPSAATTTLYAKNTVKQLRAGTWENMAFFGGIENVGGHVVEEGVAEVAGRRANKLRFVHDIGISYVRLFDTETGRLLLTETDRGVQIKEEGEFLAGGIRFPKRIINTSINADGKTHIVTVTIEKVTVNEKFPDEIFGVPLTPLH